MIRLHKLWPLFAVVAVLLSACGPAPQIPVTGGTAKPTPQNPLVIKSTLCWLGPGPAYEVSSTLKAGTRVTLLGRGSIDGWWIVRNPIYRDPCWVEASAIRIEPGYSLANLQTYFPPPTATPTPTATPSPTPTP